MNRSTGAPGRSWNRRLCGGLAAGAALAVGIFSVRFAGADIQAPAENDQYITQAVVRLLADEHMSRHDLDNEISGRCLDRFLKMLDPMKVYFLESDVENFRKQRDQLDDLVKRGDVRFAYTVFNTFLRRVDERVKMVDELLNQDHDFTVDEDMVVDPDTATYAKSEADARDLWRKRIKYDLLDLKADNAAKKHAESDAKDGQAPKLNEKVKPEEDPRERLKRRYHSFAKRMHQIDGDELLEMFLTSLTTAYDPHTSYMSPRTVKNFEIDMKLQLDGIGAALMADDGYTVVSKVVPGGAADKDGRLKAEDRIIGVGQGSDPNGPIDDVVDMKLSDVVERIRGKRGTVVRLKVQPGGTGAPEIYDITRDEIKLTDAEARGQIVDETKNGQTYRVGVIDLPSFYMDMEGARLGVPDFKSTTRDVRKLLEDFKAKGVDAVVLDLRRNGGGSLTEAISLTGLFIDEGSVVQVKDAEGHIQNYPDLEPGAVWDGPLVVLTSKFSASASEIFAGAIQDYGRGVIVGDKTTHGKGTVQSLLDISRRLFRTPSRPDLGALKVTMQQFYRPNGDSTQNRGVVADVELPSITTQLPVGESDMPHALAFDHIPAAPYRKLHQADKQVVDQLNKLSIDRRKQSPDFQKVEKRIERYLAQKNRKTVPLNEQKFLAEREELSAEKEEDRQFEELNKTDKPIFDSKNYYNQEALQIVLDYLQLQKLAQAN